MTHDPEILPNFGYGWFESLLTESFGLSREKSGALQMERDRPQGSARNGEQPRTVAVPFRGRAKAFEQGEPQIAKRRVAFEDVMMPQRDAASAARDKRRAILEIVDVAQVASENHARMVQQT